MGFFVAGKARMRMLVSLCLNPGFWEKQVPGKMKKGNHSGCPFKEYRFSLSDDQFFNRC